jgi:hypothetical protein
MLQRDHHGGSGGAHGIDGDGDVCGSGPGVDGFDGGDQLRGVADDELELQHGVGQHRHFGNDDLQRWDGGGGDDLLL